MYTFKAVAQDGGVAIRVGYNGDSIDYEGPTLWGAMCALKSGADPRTIAAFERWLSLHLMTATP